jgi:hypothetical protein
VAVLLVVKVNVLTVSVEPGLKDAVTPAGRPEAVRLTLPVNPFSPVTVIWDIAEEPWATATNAGDMPREKLPDADEPPFPGGFGATHPMSAPVNSKPSRKLVFLSVG